jgi:hypothetical protein
VKTWFKRRTFIYGRYNSQNAHDPLCVRNVTHISRLSVVCERWNAYGSHETVFFLDNLQILITKLHERQYRPNIKNFTRETTTSRASKATEGKYAVKILKTFEHLKMHYKPHTPPQFHWWGHLQILYTARNFVHIANK